MDSSWNDDLQAYYNQISKKAYNFQHEISQSSISISTPTHISDAIKGRESAPLPFKNQDEKMSKIKLLEKKYSKMPVKNEGKRQLSVSWSLEEFNSAGVLESESESPPRANADISAEPYNDYSSNLNLNASSETRINLENVPTLNENQSEGKQEDLIHSNYSQSLPADDKSPFFASGKVAVRTRRKSSTVSLLMNKDGIFYSSSISTDPKVKPKPLMKLVTKDGKFDKNNSSCLKSSSVSTQATESIDEEVPIQEEPTHTDREGVLNLQTTGPKKANLNREITKQERLSLSKKLSTSSQRYYSSEGGRCATSHRIKKKGEETKIKKKPSHRTKKIIMTKKPGVELNESSPCESTDSLSPTSPLDSSSSFSFTVKVKKNKYKKHKRRLKKENELTELIVKTLIKNLPLLMWDPFRHHRTEYSEPCGRCNQGDWTAWKVTNSRVDDALRQSIQLTRQFIDVHEKFLLTHTRSLSPFRYTSLKRP